MQCSEHGPFKTAGKSRQATGQRLRSVARLTRDQLASRGWTTREDFLKSRQFDERVSIGINLWLVFSRVVYRS